MPYSINASIQCPITISHLYYKAFFICRHALDKNMIKTRFKFKQGYKCLKYALASSEIISETITPKRW